MFFIEIIIKFIIFSIICLGFYALNQLVKHKKKNVSQKPKQENFTNNILKWFYSDRHPQQKFYRNLYNTVNEREKELEKQRMEKR